jgi:hypothetical protein
MLSSRKVCRLMSSRTGGANSRHRQIDFRHDGRASCDPVNLAYLGRLEITVGGLFTRKLYRFSPLKPVQQVDPRDAFYLLASTLFRVAS